MNHSTEYGAFKSDFKCCLGVYFFRFFKLCTARPPPFLI